MGGTRVLQVVPYFEGAWGYGGIPRVAAILAAALARRGHRVTVCTTDACDSQSRLADEGRPGSRLRPWKPRTSHAGVELRVFPNLSNSLAYRLQLFQPLGLRGWLRAHAGSFDVAHIHGHHHLPGAMAAAALRRAGVPYLVAPNGTAPIAGRRRLAKLAFAGTLGRKVLRGSERLAALAAAEVVAYAGHDEVFGLVALEALLSGTPVVVADDSGCGEVVARVGGGLAVEPGDPAALARAIAAILSEPARWRAAARDAALEIRERFASDVVAARCEEVYQAAVQPALRRADESQAWTRRLPA